MCVFAGPAIAIGRCGSDVYLLRWCGKTVFDEDIVSNEVWAECGKTYPVNQRMGKPVVGRQTACAATGMGQHRERYLC